MRSPTYSLIYILGWLKSDMRVILFCFGFDWQILVKKRKLPIFGKSDALCLGVGALA